MTVSRRLEDRVRELRADRGIAVLEGFHALKHALRFGAVVELALAADPAAVEALAAELAQDVRPALRELVRPAPAALTAVMAPRARRTEVIAFARRPVLDASAVLQGPPGKPIVLLEDPRNLGNLGAVIRVAAAADAAAVLTTGHADPWDPGAIRGSAGLHFALPVARLPSIATGGRTVVAVDPAGSTVLGTRALPAGVILAFGSERTGLSSETLALASMRVRIPMRSGVSSLNLATAVAVALFTPPPSPATGRES